MGSSLCYSSSLLILPRYHTKLWSLAHGIALAGNGIGGMGLSPANGALLQSVNVKTAFKVSFSYMPQFYSVGCIACAYCSYSLCLKISERIILVAKGKEIYG